MTPRHLILAAVLVAGVVPSPAAAQSRTEAVLLGELRQNQEQLTRLTALIAQLADRVTAVDKRMSDQENIMTKGLADQGILIRGLQGTMQTMREKLEDSALRTTQTTQEIAAVREGVRMLTDQVNILIGLLQPPSGAETGGAGLTSGGAKPVQMPPSPASLMQPAMADRLAGRYSLAVEGFEELIKTFPNSPEAGKAQFFIGEVYREMNKPKEALVAYDKAIANSRDAEYVRDALLMKGSTYLDVMKQPANARETWLELIKKFPDSQQALSAQQRLKGIKGDQ